MTANRVRLLPDELRSVAFNPGASYIVLDGPLEVTPRIVKFTNNTDGDVLISWDGVTDHEILPAGSFLLLDIAANKQQDNTLYISAGTQFWVKNSGSAGTVGAIYLSVYYA